MKDMPSFLQLRTHFPFPWLSPGSTGAAPGQEKCSRMADRGSPTCQKSARAHQLQRKKINKLDTQQKMTSSPLGISYQGGGFLKGIWALRQNWEQRKKTYYIHCFFRSKSLFPKQEGSPRPPRMMGSSLLTQEQGRSELIQTWVLTVASLGFWGQPYEGKDCLS